MKFLNSIREVINHPILSFDRSFSERGMRQLYWLAGAVATVFVMLFLIGLFFPFEEVQEGGPVMGRFLRMITLFIDPGAVEKLQESTQIFGIVVAI